MQAGTGGGIWLEWEFLSRFALFEDTCVCVCAVCEPGMHDGYDRQAVGVENCSFV